MSSEFTSSLGDDSARLGYDSNLSSQRFDSAVYEDYADYADGGEASVFEEPPPHPSGEAEDEGPTLPAPEELEKEVGVALQEWRRQNVIWLEEKEKKEKEMVKKIIAEAEEYKAQYYEKWKMRCENSKADNREKEKLFLESREKFHAETSKAYWKAITELIPKEIPNIERKGKKEKKPSIIVIQGPKPGKPTELSRMRQILVKLKHTPPPHMSPPPSEPAKDAKPQTKTAVADSLASGLPSVSEKEPVLSVTK